MTWDFWADNKDAIETVFAIIGGLIAVGGVIWFAFKWGFLRSRSGQTESAWM